MSYVDILSGDEKGEAQVFCDRLFQAFGHAGYKEAGASLEYRIKKTSTKGTSFADLVWKPRVLIEMKKRGEKLFLHYDQAFKYWLDAVPNRPRYVVLCNFDEFWIYDFDKQLKDPVDKVDTKDLLQRYSALNFLFPENKAPTFGNDRERVSRAAAAKVAELFREIVNHPKRKTTRQEAQRFVLQTVVAMFAEDIDLLPKDTIVSIVDDCLNHNQSSHDLFKGLFQQMDDETPAKAGRYKSVPYFNGGLFSEVYPIELNEYELKLLGGDNGAATYYWPKVNPAIFGTLFEQSMDKKIQHKHGRHFTSEADIMRIVGPTIVNEIRDEIDKAGSLKELIEIRKTLANIKVLDPSCGSGNFLYVAFRELAHLDTRLMARIKESFSVKEFEKQFKNPCVIKPSQFYGLDNDPFAVELAKVTLMIAKKLVLDEAVLTLREEADGKGNLELGFAEESALPLDNLDNNIICADALFTTWPEVDYIIGNPPFQSKNKAQEEMGGAYLNNLREKYPDIDGRADYCVYWFRIAHDRLKSGQSAGLVATNTIRQNYTREAGLDYITANNGIITEAVSDMIWPGEAVVHVSIVNWSKGVPKKSNNRLYRQVGNQLDEGWSYKDLTEIGPSLSDNFEVGKAKKIKANAKHGMCFQGQTHGHKAFLILPDEAKLIIKADHKYEEVLKPFMISDDLVGKMSSRPSRYVIDFSGKDILDARQYEKIFGRIEASVLPDRQAKALKEEKRNNETLSSNPNAKINKHHANFLNKWWRMSYERQNMMEKITEVKRYIVCGRVTKRPIFDFVSSKINPNDALTVFCHDDDYSFGILQSSMHWEWFNARCSTIKSDPRYTSNTCLLYTSPSPRDRTRSRMPSSA